MEQLIAQQAICGEFSHTGIYKYRFSLRSPSKNARKACELLAGRQACEPSPSWDGKSELSNWTTKRGQGGRAAPTARWDGRRRALPHRARYFQLLSLAAEESAWAEAAAELDRPNARGGTNSSPPRIATEVSRSRL